ncbi:protein quick-to-court isoform X1 [Linepithema humile]|uniref:protein quick-to-court isoform X1 n=1 Tax=Linepithema humile TaxID=83485 RepID=UPI00351F5C3A
MNLMDRMACYDSERSLHSLQLMQPGHSTRVAATPTSPTTPTMSTCAVVSTKVTATTSPTHVPSPESADEFPAAALSPLDSRIPRPSPSALRRAASLRVRGERAHYPRATTALVDHQHYYRRHNHLLQSSQQHQHPDHRTFPVITENGTDSPRQRSLSLSLTPVRPRPCHAASGATTTGANDDSDAESVKSYSSACSTASACEHASFALNGTTWSGRSRKYVVHCSNHVGDSDQYLTPTQRAAKQVRKFQALLRDARKELEEKDREILRLTKEVVELRLYKASLNSPDERTDSSDALTVRENNPFSPESPSKDLPDEGVVPEKSVASPETPEKCRADLPASLADSGHFEDGSVHSKDSVCLPESQPEIVADVVTRANVISGDIVPDIHVTPTSADEERRRLVSHYEGRIEDMHRRHVDELQEVKQKHNDKVESLLNQLSEVNTRYCEVRPAMDVAEARARELEAELEAVKTELNEERTLLSEQEERNKHMYLKMYAKGQEAARIEQADQILIQAHQTPPKVTVAELLQQLTVTQAELENIKDTSYSPEPHISAEHSQSLLSAQEAVSLWVLGTRKAMYRRIVEARSSQGTLDPEITLQFLKSAIYYFLTDKENHHGHLNAIESILGFTDAEKHNIDKLYRSTRK